MNNERLWYTVAQRAAIVLAAMALAACGPGGGGGVGGGSGPATLSPDTADVPVGGRTTFTLSPSQAATWTVEGDVGGSATIGTISAIGAYTAPFVIPSPTTVTIGASVATNTATVRVVSRFIDDGALTIGTCPSLASICINALAAPDLNGDGLSDLVTADTASETFSVTLRASASSFYAPASYDVGSPNTSEPQALAIADLDGDSTLDVAVADAGSTSRAVRSRLGFGTGAFGAELATALSSTSDPLSMATGHFDTLTETVRRLDVAVARFGNNTDPSELTIFHGDGTGAFTLLSTITSGVSLPVSVIAADFNNDQLDDLAVANSGGPEGNTVSVFFGVGNGTFEVAESYAVAGGPSAVVAVDLNGDQFLDLAVTAAVDNTLTFILNKGASGAPGAHFQVPSQPYATGAQPIALAAADINRDGLQDLAVVNRVDKTVTVFLGYGDGTVAVSETYPVGNAPQSVAVGDFNGDGWPDLAVANSGDDTVTILRNRGS